MLAVDARRADAGAGVAAHRDAGRAATARGTRRSTSTASTAGSRSTASRRRASPICCRAVFDRRFLIEEGFDAAKQEIDALVAQRRGETPGRRATTLRDLMVVASGADARRLAGGRARSSASIRRVLGRDRRAGRQPGHLRSQARRAHRRRPALRRLRARRARAGASAGRVVPHRRSGERDQGHRAGDARPDGRREID